MYNSLLAQGLRVTELLLESVGDPRQLAPALRAMTMLMDADAGMLASGRRSEAGTCAMLIATRQGSYTAEGADAAFPAFSCYRRWGLRQPAGRLHRDADIRRPAQEDDGAAAIDRVDASPGERCMAHIDAGDDSVCYVGFSRQGDARFDPERISLAESLMPHLRQAYAINRRFESMRAVSAAVMERADVISQVYNLSTRESALACSIASGKSLEDIARENKRSLEAVRSQLKRIFRKTGTSRQAELVTLVLSGPAAMTP